MKKVKGNIIEILEMINAEMKAEHMAKDMVEGVTEEEIKKYRERFKAINITIEVLKERL